MKKQTLWLAVLLCLSLCLHGTGQRAEAALPRRTESPSTLPEGPEWTWQNPTPQGHDLHAVWGSGPDDVFAVGQYGTVLHYDGGSWRLMRRRTTATLRGVWGSSGGDVFAVGEGGTILHYDGLVWRPMEGSPLVALQAVWGSAGGDVFVVGEGGAIFHYDGSRWTTMESGVDGDLTAVWGNASDDVFAVGRNGTILHYDGRAWGSVESGSVGEFTGVWGTSSSDVFVVGGDEYPNPGVILHYDGTRWETLESGPARGSFSAVSGRGSNEMFVVNTGYDVYGFGSVYGYDGSALTPMDTSRISVLLMGIWASEGDDVFVVGSGGTILHYDGGAWQEMSRGAVHGLRAISGAGGDRALAVGATPDGMGIVLHFAGDAWDSVDDLSAPALFGVWSSGADEAFAAGIWGTILRYDGVAWTEMASGTEAWLYAVWGSSSGDVFAVGERGTVLHYDGQGWSAMESGTETTWVGVWGSGPDDVFIVGYGGAMAHYDGEAWSDVYTGTDEALQSVWGTGPNDAFAVGNAGTILHYDGTSWDNVRSGVDADLHGVWGSGPDDVFAVGSDGTILHYDGVTWHGMFSGTNRALTGIWGNGPDDVYAVGDTGTILRYDVVGEGGAGSGGGTTEANEAGAVKWIVRVSVASDGTEGNGSSGNPSISDDGRYVAFQSAASNLVPGDTNERPDVFVHDLRTGQTVRVSISSTGAEADASSSSASISSDGRYAAFTSGATNLVSVDTNGEEDVFVHDLKTGETTRVSVSSDGEEGNGSSFRPAIAGDGRHVAFVSVANNLVENDANACGGAADGHCPDVFVHDLQTGETDIVSVASDGSQQFGETAYNSYPDISDDGRFAVLNSWAPLSQPGSESEFDQVYIRDREEGVTELVSPDFFIESFSWYPSISADGRYVAFVSKTYMIISGEGNECQGSNFQECPHVYVRDMATGTFERASVNSLGKQAIDGYSGSSQISADGSAVVFSSGATNLVPGDTNNVCEYDSFGGADDNCYDVFLHDLTTSETFRVSVSPDGRQANGGSGSPSVSARGERVAFATAADNLIEGDTNEAGDVFVVGLTGESPRAFLGGESADDPVTPSPEQATPAEGEDAPVEEAQAPTAEAAAVQDESTDEDRNASGGLLETLLARRLWLVGLAVALVVLLGLGVAGVVVAVLITRGHPSARAPVLVGCGAGGALLLILAIVAAVALAGGLPSRRGASPEAKPMATPSPPAVAQATPTSTRVAEAQPTATELPPTSPEPTSESGSVTSTPPVPTSTPRPTATLDPLAQCASAPQQGLGVGDRVVVCTQSDRLTLRSEPRRAGSEVLMLDPGSPLTIVGGPACADDWLWWQVTTGAGVTGWVAEGGDAIDPYFICEAQACEPVTGPFSEVWATVQDEIGCPTGAAFQGLVAEERFEGGIMLWREAFDTARSPVLYNDGTWRYYAHTPFAEGSPEFSCVDEDTPARCPPTPKRGFGMMWCSIPELRTRLGNALDCERGYQGTMQTFTQGFLLLNDRGELYALFDSGRWRRLQ